MRQSILIIGPSWVGDMMMAHSLFIALKEQNEAIEIDVVAPAWCKPILARMPEVRNAIIQPVNHGVFGWKTRKELGHQLRKQRYTQAIILPNSWKSALIPWFAKVPVRTGWRGEMRYGLLNDLRILDKTALPLMVQRFVSLAHPAQSARLPPTYKPPQLQSKPLSTAQQTQWGIVAENPLLALCPGAEFGPAKQWPTTHYAAIATYYAAQGWQICLLGSAADTETASHIRKQTTAHPDTILNLCGQTELTDAIDIMAHANAVISNDSGLMHLAAALNKPLVTIYGATSPSFTPPLNIQAKTIQIPVDCGPCFQRECSQQHHQCMQDLSPQQVISQLDDLLA
jgi:heptosyltransferase-2